MLADRYELVEKIDEGGMGEVWRGKQVALGREVAVKLIRAEQGSDLPRMRERFQREAELAARVEHRNVIDIIDFGTVEDDAQFLVMPYLRGESLEARLRRPPTPTLEEILRWTRSVLGGLGAIHDQGIVHRDLKPGNVFLAHDADGVVPKLLDFGISRADTGEVQASALTQRGSAMGTPQYMAPEQFESARDVDLRADLYSLGALLYEALSGQLPFPGEEAFSIYRAILQTEATPLATLRPELPKVLCDLVHRALAKDPTARYATARQMRNALDTVVISGAIAGVNATAVAGVGTPMSRDLGTAPTEAAPLDVGAENAATVEAPAENPATPQTAEVVKETKREGSKSGGVFFGLITLAAMLGAAASLYSEPEAPVAAPAPEPVEEPTVAAPPAASGLLLGSAASLDRLALRWSRLAPEARPDVRFVARGERWAAIASPTADPELAAAFARIGETTPEPVEWDASAGLTPALVRTTVRLNVHVGPDIESDTLRVAAHDTLVIALYGDHAGHRSATEAEPDDGAVTYFVISRNDAGWARSKYLEPHVGCIPLPAAIVRAASGGARAIRRDMTVSRTTVFAEGTRHDAFLLAARDRHAQRSYVGLFEARGACRVRELLSMHELPGVLDEYFLTETARVGGESLLVASTHPEENPPADGVLDWEVYRMTETASVWQMEVPTSPFLGRRAGAVAGTRDRALRGRPSYVLSVRLRRGQNQLYRWADGELLEGPAP